jgi:hypothetical protein
MRGGRLAGQGRAAPAHGLGPRLVLAGGAVPPESQLRDAVLAILVRVPALLPDFAHEVEAMDCEGRAGRDPRRAPALAGRGGLRDALDGLGDGGAARPHVAILPR